MIVIEFGDYQVPLAVNEWRRLEALAGGSVTLAGRRECTTGSLTSAVLEAARACGRLGPGLVSLSKDLFDYADLAAARGHATPV